MSVVEFLIIYEKDFLKSVNLVYIYLQKKHMKDEYFNMDLLVILNLNGN